MAPPPLGRTPTASILGGDLCGGDLPKQKKRVSPVLLAPGQNRTMRAEPTEGQKRARSLMTDLVKNIERNPDKYGSKFKDVSKDLPMGVPIKPKTWGPKEKETEDPTPDFMSQMKENASNQDKVWQDIIKRYENVPTRKKRASKKETTPKKKACDIRGYSKLKKAELIQRLSGKVDTAGMNVKQLKAAASKYCGYKQRGKKAE
jgi:hypothetical protein